VMSECSLSGRGQGDVSNLYIVDLKNFATASRRYTGDIHNSNVVGLFMTPETMGADSVPSWLSAHCLSCIGVKMGWFGVVRGHSRSSAMSPFDRARTTSYSTLIETMCLSFTVFDI